MSVPNDPWRCDECGGVLRIGDWPHCKGNPAEHTPEGRGMLGEFHPYVDENLGPVPVEVRSLAQRHRLMKEAGVDYRGVRRGMPRQEI